MSEKNVGQQSGGVGGAQWTKTAAAASTIQKQATLEPVGGCSSLPLFGQCGIPGLQQQPPDLATYISGRFQAPPIHHGTAPTAPLPNAAGIHQPQVSPSVLATPTPTTVPAPSGFVPPPYPIVASTGSTVLTPSPFGSTDSVNPNPGLAFVTAAGANTFGLEQFQRLNAQQQIELSKKIATAINAGGQVAAAAINATTTSNALALTAAMPSPCGTGQQIPASMQQQPLQQTLSIQRVHTSDVVVSTASGGSINSQIVDNVINAIGTGASQVQGRLIHVGVKAPDQEKMRRVQQVVESGIDDFSKQQIAQILERISTLKPVERLLLYLRLPGETTETDPLRQPQNPLGTRSEITHTINWVRSHLEHDPQVSIPKQDVYNDYITYCDRLNIKPLSTADFGKVMKQVFPGIRPRRLGTRGNSRYCYAAMRKTTQLVPPQLPQLSKCASSSDAIGSNELNISEVSREAENESWEVVKTWAEKLLNVKVESVSELASRIKNNSANVNLGTASSMRLGPKKYTPREPKEKRLLADLGPLKKRRKKKRKGSSSSESSCNQLQASKDATSSQDSSTYMSGPSAASTLHSDDEKKSIALVKVKQEIIDSPNYQPIHATHGVQQSLVNAQKISQAGLIIEKSYLGAHQQLMPMNLATEQRTVLTKAPSSVRSGGSYHAVRNLTPKILEMSSTSGSPALVTEQQLQTSTVTTPQQTPVIIKDEVEDYNTSNIFCKKVLKAQQTKGFWTNSPSSSVSGASAPPPIITTTAATPPPQTQPIVQGITALSTVPAVSSPVAHLPMGPPAQMNNNTSISPSSSLDSVPKVVSRNSLSLRAKNLAENAAATDDSGLPENLGLPRERVISICNMDKHELDDYFLPGEEENSEDQETELLQYFQTGDAEEKRLNSLDAAEYRNLTANCATTAQLAAIPTTAPTSVSTTTRSGLTITPILSENTPILSDIKTPTPSQQQQHPLHQQQTQSLGAAIAPSLSISSSMSISNSGVGSGNGLQMQNVALNQSTTLSNLTPNTVGSASASLALMSQKHQQHQQQVQQRKQLSIVSNQTTTTTSKVNVNNNKRKISLSNSNTLHNNKSWTFLPISPNINNTPVKSSNMPTTTLNGISGVTASASVTCFASPGLTRLRSRVTPLTKQQSLDFEGNDNGSGDPMIGASRRRRSYIYTMPSNTSASAPPSPSVLQQYSNSFNIWALGNGSVMNGSASVASSSTNYNVPTNNVALLTDQNSMDLENSLALASATCDVDFQLAPLNETQRSQSVPLSQLQRIQSPTFSRQLESFQTNYSACTSVNQPSGPLEFGAGGESTTLFSESSNSQSALKINDVDVLAPDSTGLLDDVDVSAMLSPDFDAKFSSIAQTQNAATTCSSTGSSSGYSSGACNNFGNVITGGAVGIVSRSVPSTPLPHHNQNIFGGFYSRRGDAEFSLSPLTTHNALATSQLNNNNNNHSTSYGSRVGYDISKSMPTTPITTPCFRYSPTDTHRDFLINGNTIDSLVSSTTYGGAGTPAGGDSSGVGNLSTDTLIDDSVPTSSDVEAIMADSDILNDL